jgi:hypothetical protein
MKTWEYKQIYLEFRQSASEGHRTEKEMQRINQEVGKALNPLGKEGWRVVSVINFPHGIYSYIILLERETSG